MTVGHGHVGPQGASIEADFWAFHEANPHVYTALVTLAREWKSRRGAQRVGIGMLFEVLRWQMALRTTSDDFKLNNNFRSYYARLIMERELDLKGIFETRSLRAAEPFDGRLFAMDRVAA